MNGSIVAATDSAYATLARLKIALPLAQAAIVHPGGNVMATMTTLIDLTRTATDQLAQSALPVLRQVTADRRARLLRSLAQEVAYIIGRAHERAEQIDATRLIEHVNLSLSSIDAVPGARASPFFREPPEANCQWQLAVTRAASRIVESLMSVPDLARLHAPGFLERLLARVESMAGEVQSTTDEERRTVRLSLLGQLSKSHARLIAHRMKEDIASRRLPRITELFSTLDAYHLTLETAMRSLAMEAPDADCHAVGGMVPRI